MTDRHQYDPHARHVVGGGIVLSPDEIAERIEIERRHGREVDGVEPRVVKIERKEKQE